MNDLISDDTTPADDTTPTTPERVIKWGIQPPNGTRLAWGARAIYKLHTTPGTYRRRPGKRPLMITRETTTADIDLLWDRQGSVGALDVTDKERTAFDRWLNTKGLPALRRECVKQYITGDTDAVVTLTIGDYMITASPRASHGYLYIGAWLVAAVEPVTLPVDIAIPTATRRARKVTP